LQTHVGGPEVARDADEVVLLRTAAVDDLLLFGVAKRGDGDDVCDGESSSSKITTSISCSLQAKAMPS
jgi:hypothetical protein